MTKPLAVLVTLLCACGGAPPSKGETANGPPPSPETTTGSDAASDAGITPPAADAAGAAPTDGGALYTLVSASASASSVAAGQTITLSASLSASIAQSDMIVDLEVHDASDQKIAQTFVSAQSFAAGQVLPFTWSYAVPASTPAGTYTLCVGVFLADWSNAPFLDKGAASFAVTATPAASGKAALIAYLTGLRGQTKHILVGSHTNYWDTDPTDDITGLESQTGKKPAIVGVMMDNGDSYEGQETSQYDGVTLANAYIAQGSIVMMNETGGTPYEGATMWNQTPQPTTSMPAANFANITKPGTAEYQSFQTYMQKVATELKKINGTILFRAFWEQNGNWFWWGNQDADQFVAVWKMFHDYLSAQGLDNLVWVFAANGGVGNYTKYYPGADYVDVVALDCYPPTSADVTAWQELDTLGKPEIYAEMGASLDQSVAADTLDYGPILSYVEQTFPHVVGLVVWCQGVALDRQNGAATVMNDSQVITQADLPAGL